MNGKLLVICGLTATGKTQLGVHLAKKFSTKGGGEIVSADSRQVYRGMDIGTGKDLPVNSKFKIKNEKLQIKIQKEQILRPYRFSNIPVWMLDVVGPKESFSVAEYHKLAHKVIEDIWQRGKLPILVGGTGLYLKAVTTGIDTLGVPPSPELRQAYTQKSTGELLDILFHLNADIASSLNASDRQNKLRLIRKIEIAQVGVKEKVEKRWKNVEFLIIGLNAPPDLLRQRIEKRIDNWVKEGIEEEILGLLAGGVTWQYQSMTALGYREWRSFFEGKITKEEVIENWKKNEWHYSKRQLTWFKKDKRIIWFDVSKAGWEEKVEKKAAKWYNRNDEND